MIRFKLRSWRMITIKGSVTTLIGLFSLILTSASLRGLSLIWAILLVISAGVLIYYSIYTKKSDKIWGFIESSIDIIYALILIFISFSTLESFLILLTSWISVMGLLQISNAYRIRSLYHHWQVLLINGVLAIVFSLSIIVYPEATILTKSIIMLLLTLIFIAFLVISSIYLKKLVEDINLEIPHQHGEKGNQELSYY